MYDESVHLSMVTISIYLCMYVLVVLYTPLDSAAGCVVLAVFGGGCARGERGPVRRAGAAHGEGGPGGAGAAGGAGAGGAGPGGAQRRGAALRAGRAAPPRAGNEPTAAERGQRPLPAGGSQ